MKKNAAKENFLAEQRTHAMTKEVLKPCPACKNLTGEIFISCSTEPAARNFLDVSVKCKTCGYELKLEPVQNKNEYYNLGDCFNLVVEAWNKIMRRD